jgi:ADP-heptose:LPS heptosyltransferase
MEAGRGMKPLVVGFASGLGNCIYMLPAVKALKLMGREVDLFVQTDFDTVPLWKRCAYADRILTDPSELNGQELACGQWEPAAWRAKKVTQYRLPRIHDCEWRSNMRLAHALGWRGQPPDVSDWCLGLDRARRWDVGVAPGSKRGVWMRKRWPGMKTVAGHFLHAGRSVAVFGLPEDDVESIPGEHVDTKDIGTLPDALAGCGIVIGGDTGVTHLASSLGIPVVTVYTATSEVKAEPVCRPNRKVFGSVPCRPCVSTPRWQSCRDWRCREIDPRKVIAAAEEMINPGDWMCDDAERKQKGRECFPALEVSSVRNAALRGSIKNSKG